jgi:hypothetical protein
MYGVMGWLNVVAIIGDDQWESVSFAPSDELVINLLLVRVSPAVALFLLVVVVAL